MSIEIRDGWLVGSRGDFEVAVLAQEVAAIATYKHSPDSRNECAVFLRGAYTEDECFVFGEDFGVVLGLILDWQRKQHIYGPFRPGEVAGIHMDPYPWRKKTDDGDGGGQP